MINEFEGSRTLLTTAADILAGGLGDDAFVGTYNDAGTGSFGCSDVIDGGAGSDTLEIAPIGVAAITPTDSYWSHVSNIENVLIDTTGAGAQTIATGAFFEAAFAVAGIDLTTSSNGGAMTIDASTFTGAMSLNTSSGAGAQTITTGSGPVLVNAVTGAGALTITSMGAGDVAVNATSGAGAQTITTGLGHATVVSIADAGAQTISGGNLVSVTATSTGAGAQTITSTGAAEVSVTATIGSGALTVSTGAGNDHLTAIGSCLAGAVTLSTGAGADTITLVNNGLAPAHATIVIGHSDSGITLATADCIIGFDSASDTLQMGAAAIAANFVESSVVVASFDDALIAANTAMAGLTGADRFSFQSDGTNGYLFQATDGHSTADQVVVLVGVTDAHFAACNVIA
jgi:hypothetical protein